MLEISVIIPVYKVEKYLSHCIASVIDQKFSDFELLLIDDGSPDHCGDICDEWAERDNRIHVFHQKNMGLSGARNTGIDNALGKYVVFIDSDDYVTADYLDNLLKIVSCNSHRGKGYGVQGYQMCLEDGSLVKSVSFTPDIYTPSDYSKLFSGSEIFGMFSACGKIYERCFIDAYNLRFDTDIRYAEDVAFNLQCMKYCDYMAVGEAADYIYVSYGGSMSKVVMHFDSEYYAFSICKATIGDILKKYPMSVSGEKGIWNSILFMFYRILKADYHYLNESKMLIRRRHLNILYNADLDYLRNNYFPEYLIDKIGRFLLIHGYVTAYDIFITTLVLLKVQKMHSAPGRVGTKRYGS